MNANTCMRTMIPSFFDSITMNESNHLVNATGTNYVATNLLTEDTSFVSLSFVLGSDFLTTRWMNQAQYIATNPIE